MTNATYETTKIHPEIKAFSMVYVKGYGRAEVVGINKGGVVVTISQGRYKGCTFTARFADVR